MCVLLKKLCVSECACVCLTIKRCTVYYVFVKRKKMQNPKIKLFYILTVKTIKDIYIMNERERCGLLLCRCSAPLFSVLFFLEGEYKKIPTRYFNLVSHKDNHNCSALVLQRYIPYSGAFKTISSLIFIHYSQ